MRRAMLLLAAVVVLALAIPALAGLPAGGAAPAAAPAPAPVPVMPQAAEKEEVTLLYLIKAGSWGMYPLELMSIITIAIIIERSVRLRRAHILPAGFMSALSELTKGSAIDAERGIELCRQHPSSAGRIFERAFKKAGRPFAEVEKAVEDAGEREAGRLRANIRMLSALGVVAPLMGLLGTVSGIIRAFIKIQQAGLGKPEMIAGGLYEALVNTAAGLLVAIPAIAFYYYFAHRVEKLVREIDLVAVDLVEAVGVTAK